MINVRLAEAICGVIRIVVADWETIAPAAQSWPGAAIHYFVHSDGQPAGFHLAHRL
jgi:hypothetical protein